MKRKTAIWFLSAIIIAGILSLFASEKPDGYEKAGEELGFIKSATSYFNAPLADYSLPGIHSSISQSFAGIIGVILTFVIFIMLGKLLAKKNV